MVYCAKCGTQNEDNALDCTKCKAPLQPTLPERTRQPRERRWEDECFRLPFGGTIFGLGIGGLIIFSGLAALFPEAIGHIFGLVNGVLIMVMEQFGLKMVNWGRETGGRMGNWARETGEWMGNWAREEFADIIGRMTNIRSIQMLGSFMIIIAGLVIIGIIIYNFNRTRP